MTENLTLLKLLADETRLRIINILAEGDSYVELIATKLELTPATVCYHLKKMEAAGMVNCSRAQFYIIYSLNGDIFDRPLRDLLITGDKTVDKEEAYEREVISTFFKSSSLTSPNCSRSTPVRSFFFSSSTVNSCSCLSN